MNRKKDNPVYSTETGRIKSGKKPAGPESKGDGIIRIRREVKGRGGKTVTTVSGIPLQGDALQEVVRTLKQRIGGGGSLKDGVLLLQGDHRELVKSFFEERGYTVRLAGG